MATAAKFRIDVDIHDLLMDSTSGRPSPAEAKGLTLPEPIFPQHPERLSDPGPEVRRKSASGVQKISIAPHADGCFPTSAPA